MSSHSFHPASKACGDPGLGNGYVEGCFLLSTIRKNAIGETLVAGSLRPGFQRIESQ